MIFAGNLGSPESADIPLDSFAPKGVFVSVSCQFCHALCGRGQAQVQVEPNTRTECFARDRRCGDGGSTRETCQVR